MADMSVLKEVLGLNAMCFGNALKDVKNPSHRLSDATNAFDRIAGHVVVGRFGICSMLQIEIEPLPWGDFAEFGPGAQFEETRTCPSLKEIEAEWSRITHILMENLDNVSDEVLTSKSPIPVPSSDGTIGQTVAFMAGHESYHIGQLGMLKRDMGGPPIMGA